jgi:hypothetical protein
MHPLLITKHVLGKNTLPHPNPQCPYGFTPSYDLIEKAEKGSPQLIKAGKKMLRLFPKSTSSSL